MTDENFTRIASSLLTDVRDLVGWGIDGGHTTADRLRLTIEARREEAQKLVESGLSQGDAAKVLGVNQATISRDLKRSSMQDASSDDAECIEKESKEEAPRPVARVTKAERRAEREIELAKVQVALPVKRYGVIVADPEWRFEPYSRETGMDRAADNHYPTSVTDEISQRNVPSIAAEDCVLFLWATVPMVRDAFRVMESWGFEYKSMMIWDKIHIGTGYWYRNRAELLLTGTKGNVPAPAMGDQYPGLLAIARKEHSAKPEQFLEMIEQYFPNLPKIELNRRGPSRSGWDAWGNETEQKETIQ
jgi:N6-adenosine-specific RNA methylase IME4